MKSILLTLTTLIFLTMSTHAQTATDDTEIRGLVKTMEDGWAKKDGNLFASPFADNADYVVVNGMYLKGKKAIAASHQGIFDSFYKETFIKTEVQSVRFIRPDVAIVHYTGKMTGKSNGKDVDSDAIMSLTVEKVNGIWQIDAFQNTGVGG